MGAEMRAGNLVNLNGPAPSGELDRLRSKYPSLPESYFSLLGRYDGAEGDLLGTWVRLWSAAEAYTLSDSYEVPVDRPGYFAFGSNGGGELLVCALEGSNERPLYTVPAIGMFDAELLPLAQSFDDLAARIEKAR